MTRINFPISLPGLKVTQVHPRADGLEIHATSVQCEAVCPACHSPSRRVHSYYARAPEDFPTSACCVRLHLTVKRFRCQTEGCARATFVENLPHLVAKYAHRTNRLKTAHEALAFALGGEAGSRLAQRLQMPISGDTLLRSIRKTEEDVPAEPEVLGVDDWAKRRGKVYGTILVDLERRQVIDLLTDRTAETLAAWLQKHPGVRIVARDRSSEYARGISAGAPQAEQVADRWHLLVNVREAFERLLERLRPELQLLIPLDVSAKTPEIPVRRRRHRSHRSEAARQTYQQKRHALYIKIQRLRQQGASIRAIARQIHKSPTTIYKYLAMPEFPQKLARKRMASMLAPYEAYLSQRWQAGCRNALQLWREIQEKGYPGTSRQVSKWAYERREQPAPTTRANIWKKMQQGNWPCVPSEPRSASRPCRSRNAWSGSFCIHWRSWQLKNRICGST